MMRFETRFFGLNELDKADMWLNSFLQGARICGYGAMDGNVVITMQYDTENKTKVDYVKLREMPGDL